MRYKTKISDKLLREKWKDRHSYLTWLSRTNKEERKQRQIENMVIYGEDTSKWAKELINWYNKNLKINKGK